jgi:hypothetical protein
LLKFELIFAHLLSGSSCSMSSDTSSFNSECQDDEEIALAMQAAEIANRNEARAKFRCVCVCVCVCVTIDNPAENKDLLIVHAERVFC